MAYGLPKTLRNAKKLEVNFFETLLKGEHKIFLIAILRFLLNKPEPELTNLRVKITKESTFVSHYLYER